MCTGTSLSKTDGRFGNLAAGIYFSECQFIVLIGRALYTAGSPQHVEVIHGETLAPPKDKISVDYSYIQCLQKNRPH